jgi:hypothetical protein
LVASIGGKPKATENDLSGYTHRKESIYGISYDKSVNVKGQPLEATVNELDTIRKVNEYVGANFKYLASNGWQMPKETLERGGGMCGDQALAQAAILTYHNYEAYQLHFGNDPAEPGHGFTIVRDKDAVKWYSLEYGRILRLQSSDPILDRREAAAAILFARERTHDRLTDNWYGFGMWGIDNPWSSEYTILGGGPRSDYSELEKDTSIVLVPEIGIKTRIGDEFEKI